MRDDAVRYIVSLRHSCLLLIINVSITNTSTSTRVRPTRTNRKHRVNQCYHRMRYSLDDRRSTDCDHRRRRRCKWRSDNYTYWLLSTVPEPVAVPEPLPRLLLPRRIQEERLHPPRQYCSPPATMAPLRWTAIDFGNGIDKHTSCTASAGTSTVWVAL